ncbi:MAG TPA: trypsin-like serine protease, partial [Solirubrobacteraceae bacterium]|nr:trypsin-like serine protease [Solirubrobacteraceae bacterium]
SAVSVFPGYVNGDHGDDIAMLTLSSPLTPNSGVASIAPVAQGAEPAAGTAGVFYGWGQTSPGASDGNEHYLPFTFQSALACASGLPSILCALSASGDSCPGDSGSGLTEAGLLVGVLDFGVIPTGGTGCTSGHYIGYTDLASPEIVAWLANTAVSLAPRTSDQATLAGDANAGGTDTCSAPAWSDGSNAGFAFFDAQSLTVLQSGPLSTFSIPQTLVGHQLSCAAEASSAGGTTYATSLTFLPIAASISPSLSLTITRAGRLTASASTAAVAVPLTLTITRAGAAAGARPVFTAVFADATPDLVDLENKFGAGSYDVCLSSPQTGIYAPASTCQPWVQNDATASLVSIKASSRGGRAVFEIRTLAPLLGRTVSVRWFAGSCCASGDLIAVKSVRLGALTKVAEQPRGHRRRYALVFTLPTFAYRGATLRGGSRVIFVYDYGAKATGWRKL